MAKENSSRSILDDASDKIDADIRDNMALLAPFIPRIKELVRTEIEVNARKEKCKNLKYLACLLVTFLFFCLLQLWLGEYPQVKNSSGIISLVLIPFVTAFFSKGVDSKWSGALALALFGVVLYANGILTDKDLWEIFMKKTTEK